MTRENLELGKKLIEKIDAADRLLLWAAKGFRENTGVKGINSDGTQIGDHSAFHIKNDLIMLLPEIEEHFRQMKRDYEEEFDRLK